MAKKNSSDRLCVSGCGNVSTDRIGDLNLLIAAEAAERGDPLRQPKNKKAIKEDPRWIIRIGLTAEE